MDANELKEEISYQRTLQKEYRKRLRILEQQAAKSVIRNLGLWYHDAE